MTFDDIKNEYEETIQILCELTGKDREEIEKDLSEKKDIDEALKDLGGDFE